MQRQPDYIYLVENADSIDGGFNFKEDELRKGPRWVKYARVGLVELVEPDPQPKFVIRDILDE